MGTSQRQRPYDYHYFRGHCRSCVWLSINAFVNGWKVRTITSHLMRPECLLCLKWICQIVINDAEWTVTPWVAPICKQWGNADGPIDEKCVIRMKSQPLDANQRIMLNCCELSSSNFLLLHSQRLCMNFYLDFRNQSSMPFNRKEKKKKRRK